MASYSTTHYLRFLTRKARRSKTLAYSRYSPSILQDNYRIAFAEIVFLPSTLLENK